MLPHQNILKFSQPIQKEMYGCWKGKIEIGYWQSKALLTHLIHSWTVFIRCIWGFLHVKKKPTNKQTNSQILSCVTLISCVTQDSNGDSVSIVSHSLNSQWLLHTFYLFWLDVLLHLNHTIQFNILTKVRKEFGINIESKVYKLPRESY